MKNTKNLFFLGVLTLILQFTGVAQNWEEMVKAVAPDRNSQALFGFSVAMDGDYAVLGAPENGGGSVYIFQRSAGSWAHAQTLVAPDAQSDDNFGYSVDINGDYVIVGAPNEDHDTAGTTFLSRSGSAYIFERNNVGLWEFKQKLIDENREFGDEFGNSVSISGNYAVVGAIYEEDDASSPPAANKFNAGSAFIFERDEVGVWNFIKKLVAPDRAQNDNFGNSVSISGNYIVVGARAEDHNNLSNGGNQSAAGSAYVFERIEESWTFTQKLVAPDRASSDNFGNSVAISGNYIIIGAYREDEDASSPPGATKADAGSAYIFNFDNNSNNYVFAQKLVANNRNGGDRFGHSVDISGNMVIVGANKDDLSGSKFEGGSAHIFERVAGSWSQVQRIEASDKSSFDIFGTSVAISGDYALVGAPDEDHDASSPPSAFKSRAGSAYFFSNTPFCSIRALTAGTQTACVNDTFTQGIVITYAQNLSSGTLDVNGQSFAITGSPQTVTLTGLIADGLPVNVTAQFSADTGCTFSTIGLFTAPCCIETSTYFNDSICLGDSLYVGGAWQTTAGQYTDTAIAQLGCDSLLITNLYLRDSSVCIIDTTEKVLYLVSDSAWTLSTEMTVATSNSYPWPGVATLLPHDSTFTLDAQVGQPYGWTHLYTVMGSQVIKAEKGVRYYRYTFEVSDHQALNARFRMFVDDNMQIFINRHEIALEEDMGKDNWRTANHDILFHANGVVDNGYNGGDPFDTYTTANLDNVFQPGWNDIILAIRNRTSKNDVGGFSFRMDLDKAGEAVIVKKDGAVVRGEAEATTDLTLYPNPATDYIAVVFTQMPNTAATISISDLSGKLMQSESFSTADIENGISIDVSDYVDGVYLVKIQTGDQTFVERLIKQ